MRIWKDVWDYAKMIIIVVLIVTLINNVVLINAKIPSESMHDESDPCASPRHMAQSGILP